MRDEQKVYILGGKRTPFCEWVGGKRGDKKPGGALKNFSAIDLGAIALKETLKHLNIKPEAIEHVIFGNAEQTGPDALYGARLVGLKAGLPKKTPALTINRLCGTGHEAIRQGALAIMSGEIRHFAAVGGMENLSQAPYIIRGIREYLTLRDYLGVLREKGRLPSLNEITEKISGAADKVMVDDLLWTFLKDPYSGLMMAETAEKLAKIYKITREETDRFAFRSHILTKKAAESGIFSDEIIPVRNGDTQEIICLDDHFVPDCSLEKLSALPPVFVNDGLVTAGNASGIVDGAAALILASEKALEDYHLKALGKVISWGVAGVEPSIMGIGPLPASQKALKKAGLKKDQIDLWEINEAFSCQYLAVEKAMGLDRNKVNVNGGAIGIGHPFAATGIRQILTLLLELKRREKRFGLATACIGGGQGIAIIVEALH